MYDREKNLCLKGGNRVSQSPHDPVPLSERFAPLGATTLLAPVPAVLVSCRADEASAPNVFTVAWTGTVCSTPPMLSISVRRERYSHALITQSGEFYVNFPSRALCRATDFCGVKSGRDVDKFAACGLTPVMLDALRVAPAIAQCPAAIACRLDQVIPLGSHDLFLARIVQTYVHDSLIDESGSLDLERAQLIAYRHGDYVGLGRKLGFFGFSVASPKALKRRMGKDAPPAAKHPPVKGRKTR